MPQPTAVALDQVDLTDLDAFARNEGWAMFDTLRAEDPVHWTPEAPPNSGFWAVTRYQNIDAVDRDSETFTSTRYVNLEEVDDDLDGSAALHAGDRRAAPPRSAEADPARVPVRAR